MNLNDMTLRELMALPLFIAIPLILLSLLAVAWAFIPWVVVGSIITFVSGGIGYTAWKQWLEHS